MTDFPRLSSMGDDGAALLRAAHEDAPPSDVIEKTLLAVTAGAAMAAIPTAVVVKATKTGTALAVKYALVGFASGVLVMGGGAAIHHAATSGPPSTMPVSAPSKPAVHASPLPSVRGPVEAPAPVPVDAPPRLVAPMAPEPKRVGNRLPAPSVTTPSVMTPPVMTPPVTPASAPVPADDGMNAEVRFLDEARRLVADGRGRDALAVLARYAREVPNQRLAPEAWYLEMEANHSLGDRAAAMRSAKSLLDRYPDGPHAARARRIANGE